MELTERALLDAFARHGLKRVGAKGEAFDPKIHQAIAHIPSEQPANTVAEVMQPGYVLGERTLRAAMVAVSSGRGAENAEHRHQGLILSEAPRRRQSAQLSAFIATVCAFARERRRSACFQPFRHNER